MDITERSVPDDMMDHRAPSPRPSEPSLYMPQLDGLRFFAFLMVFVHHLPAQSGGLLGFLFAHGYSGVSLFLTLSAYLLARILTSEHDARGRIDLRRYLIRRSLRIWPLYFAFVLAAFALDASNRPASTELVVRFFGLLTFSDNVLTAISHFNPIRYTAHLWTISLEEQFYLVLPTALAWSLARRRSLLSIALWTWALFAGLRVIAVAARVHHPFIWTLPISADAILAGIALSDDRVARWLARLPPSASLFGGLALFASLRFLPPVHHSGVHLLWSFALTGVGAALLCHAALTHPWLSFLGQRWLRYLGKISYGLYVFHIMGIAAGGYVAQHTTGAFATHALVGLACTCALAACSYELLEKPFLRIKGRFEVVRTRPA